MSDFIDIEACPYGEECAQIGAPDYHERVRKEGRAFINQLRRQFGPTPQGFKMYLKGHQHDFGTYHMIRLEYCTEEGAQFALLIDNESPESWDEEARKELDK